MSRKNIASAFSLIIIGTLMIFAGGLISYIYFTEITPPNYDAYYQRYVGSSFPRILGILILMTGLTLFSGSSIFLVYAHYKDGPKSHHTTGVGRKGEEGGEMDRELAEVDDEPCNTDKRNDGQEELPSRGDKSGQNVAWLNEHVG